MHPDAAVADFAAPGPDELRPRRSATPALPAGTRLGKYEIVSRLAVGGMADVYLARAATMPGFAKNFVLKRILPRFAADPEYVSMFVDEARIQATLVHPNVVQVYDVGVARGTYFMVMEYLHGHDVRTLLRRLGDDGCSMPLAHALHIGVSVAAALDYAHEKPGPDGAPIGIVHRDVSPQNVFVTFSGAVKLLDFGLVRAEGRYTETQRGVIKGKVSYMSPEQCLAAPVDRRSDVFSLGILLYEMTTGKRLFDGTSDLEAMGKIVEHVVVPPHVAMPGYPEALERVVLRCLAREPVDRYQTARELQQDLEGIVGALDLRLPSTALPDLMETVFGKAPEAATPSGSVPSTIDEVARAWSADATPPEPMALPSGDDEYDDMVVETPRRSPLRLVAICAASLLVGGGIGVVRPWRWLSSPARASVDAGTPLATPAPPPPPVVVPAPSHRRTVRVVTAPEPASPTRAHVVPVETGRGTLVVATTPWSTVTIDGRPYGATPLVVTLPAGAHRLRLVNDGFHIDREINVRIARGETLRKKIAFTDE